MNVSCFFATAPTMERQGKVFYRPLSRRLDRCDRVIHNESGDPNGGNRRVRRVYVTMQITFLTRKSALIYRRGLRQRVASLTLNCDGDFAIRAYMCSEMNGLFLSSKTNCASKTPVVLRKWKETGYNQLWFEDVEIGVIRCKAEGNEFVLD